MMKLEPMIKGIKVDTMAPHECRAMDPHPPRNVELVFNETSYRIMIRRQREKHTKRVQSVLP